MNDVTSLHGRRAIGVGVVPSFIDIPHNIIHPLPVCRGQGHETLQLRVSEFKGVCLNLSNKPQCTASWTCHKSTYIYKEINLLVLGNDRICTTAQVASGVLYKVHLL